MKHQQLTNLFKQAVHTPARLLMPYLLAGLLTSPALAEPVVLKTGQSSLTRTRQFELRDGVVYTGPASADRSELQPLASLAGKFTSPPRFKSLHADSSIVVAEAEDGRLFFLEFPTPGTLAANVVQQWTDQWGMPFATTLKLPRGARAWSFSNRNIDVGHYEDAQGQAFFWGFAGCSTLYALSEDGRRMHYADPWLSADFSREICLPDQGSFTVENFSSSASTLFVIGRNGEMFTRLEDYDSNGGTPFFEFRYDPIPPHGLAGSDPRSEYRPRRPFPADWQPQPPIDLPGKARISRQITVLQNGKGNAARELRVAGTDATGKPGYYYKGIDQGLSPLNASVWQFKSANIQLPASDFLQVDLSAEGKRQNRKPLQTLNLTGRSLRVDGQVYPELHLQSLHFNWACGPVELRLQDKSGKVHSAKLHLADGWVPFTQPERYGNNQAAYLPEAGQVPFIRNYKGTLELPQALLQDRALSPLHFKSFALAVAVGPGWARIWNDNHLEMLFGSEPYLPLFTARLEQEGRWSADLQDAQALKAALSHNIALYTDMAAQRTELHRRKGVSFMFHTGFGLFDKIGLLTWAGPGLMKEPYWNAVQHGRTLIQLGDEWTYGMEAYTRADYTRASSILRNRICHDLQRLNQLADQQPSAVTSPANAGFKAFNSLCTQP